MKDNVRGTFNTLARAAQKLQKQISTDDVPTSDHHKMGSLKTQSQIELRENVRLKSLQQAYGIIPMFVWIEKNHTNASKITESVKMVWIIGTPTYKM